MLRRISLVATAAVLALGCGGDGREEAVQVAERWLGAVGERDFDEACALMRESAVATIRTRSGLGEKATCLGTLRTYSGAFEPGDIKGILKVGFEAEGAVKKNRVGVFPRSGPRELQVILMQRVKGEWKVASTTVGPTKPAAEPSPAPTPAEE